MNTEKPRDLALNLLYRLESRTQYQGNYLDDLFQNNPHLEERDRAFISQLVQGVLRWRTRLDWVIGQFIDSPIKKKHVLLLNILRLAVFQILFLDRVPESAAVNEAVNQASAHKKFRHYASFVNGVLRSICRGKGRITYPDKTRDEIGYLSVYYSYPRWLVSKWINELGSDSTEKLLDAQNRFPDLNIRVNRKKINREALLRELKDAGTVAVPTIYSPDGIMLTGIKGRVDKLESFKKGLFQVQDQAAQIIPYLLNPDPGNKILDICAGYGGKSTHMAELMVGSGRVLSLDINRPRLVNLCRNALRLGIDNIDPVVADGSLSLEGIFRNTFDLVLVDAPCSGLGVISRHPDGKWNKGPNDISRLAMLQKQIMNRAPSVLKRGGRILYVACSISRQENEDVVKAFLKGNNDFVLEDMQRHIPEWGRDLIDEQGFYRTYPHIHNMDGFFAALFRKKS